MNFRLHDHGLLAVYIYIYIYVLGCPKRMVHGDFRMEKDSRIRVLCKVLSLLCGATWDMPGRPG